jgi:ribosome-associated protein
MLRCNYVLRLLLLSTARTNKSVTTATLRKSVIDALEELKAKDIREIDVRGKTSIADLLVIASGTSARHVKSIADEVTKFAKKAGVMPLGVEGELEGEWVLVDLGDVIVHVMLPRIREFYGLERLWTVGDHGYDAAAHVV